MQVSVIDSHDTGIFQIIVILLNKLLIVAEIKRKIDVHTYT